jgi:tetratricopeptide (TPR) repeat protein
VADRRGSGAGPAAWGEAALVGRGELIEELVAAATAARAGHGSVVLLTGEAGIGKTSVVRALARLVTDDFDVSFGNCSADRSAPPFWPWRAVMGEDLIDAGPLDRAAADPAIGAARFELMTSVARQLVERARRRPVLHVLEDLQWADVASVLLVAHLGSVVVDAPLMVVATVRSGEPLGPQLERAIEEVRRVGRVRSLPALRDDEIAELIRAAGIAPDGGLSSVVAERTGGNPLFVTEVLRAARAADPAEPVREIVRGAIPTRVAELVADRLGRLPATVVDLLCTASVIGTDGDLRALAAVGRSDVEAVVELVEQARACRLLDVASPGRWRFRHDLVRDAVEASMDGAARARRHAAVLDALAAEGAAPVAALAGHALAAQPLLDAERAVALAARAGSEAFDHHAYEEAIVWFERALTAAPAGIATRWRADLLLCCGEAHRHLCQMDEARRAFLGAAELSEEPAQLARAAVGYADPGADLAIAFRTDDPVTVTLLERAIAAQGDDDSVTTVRLEARLAAELYFSEDPDRARELASSAVDRARRLGDRRALGAASAVHHDAYVVGQAALEEQLAGSARLLDWAKADATSGALLTARRARAFDLLAAGDLAGFDREVVAFRRIAEPLRAPGYLWWPALWSAMRALLEGHHEVAERRAFAAYEVGAASFESLALANLSFLSFFLRREQGRLAELERPVRDYASSHADVPAIRVSLALLLAETGRLPEARALLGALVEGDLARLRDRNWPASWFQLARATWIVGDEALARTLLDAAIRPTERCVTVSLATVCLGATDLATAWLLHTVGDADAADPRYGSAIATNAALGARSWLAQALVDHAVLLVGRGGSGDGDLAADHVESAIALADDIGLPIVASTAERVRLGPGREPEPSTPTFRRAGAVWDVEFSGRRVRLAHTRGLDDLAVLLARPGEEVSVLDLVSGSGPTVTEDRGAPVLDDRARREIHERLRELDATLAAAEARGDTERIALVREQQRQLAEHVARDLGLGGRSRRLGDPTERARKTVSTRIRRSIALVGRSHPELGRHLDRSIDTGTWCAYRPAEPTTWIT